MSYEQGLQLELAGNCAEAVGPLEQAADAKPKAQKRARTYGRNFITDYDPHFHLARCYAELGDREKAASYLEFARQGGVTGKRLLADVASAIARIPEALPPETPTAQAARDEPSRARAELSLRSEPPGAVVRIDDRLFGQTPLERVELDPGDHRVVVDMPGFTPYRRTLRLDPGRARELDLTLIPVANVDLVERPSQVPTENRADATAPPEGSRSEAHESGSERTPERRDTATGTTLRESGSGPQRSSPQKAGTAPERSRQEGIDEPAEKLGAAPATATRNGPEPEEQSAADIGLPPGSGADAGGETKTAGPPDRGTSVPEHRGRSLALWLVLPATAAVPLFALLVVGRRRRVASSRAGGSIGPAASEPAPASEAVSNGDAVTNGGAVANGDDPTVLSARSPSIGRQRTVLTPPAAPSDPTTDLTPATSVTGTRIHDAKRRATLRNAVAEGTTPEGAEPAIAGYALEAELGREGMATTYRGRRLSDGVPVALKVPHDSGDHSFFERFIREGKLGETLHHPNIVRIFEAGQDQGLAFIAMELIPGKTLKQVLRESGPLEPSRALHVARDIAEALDYAHAKRVVHRDLKPDNIMILPDGTTKVMDFGIARVEGQHGLTASQLFIGTPAYAAPEQLDPKRVDHRTDLYALGIILFEMLEGTTPFRSDSPLALLEMHMREPLPERGNLTRAIPADIWQLVATLCAKSKDDRFDSAQALLNALGSLINQPTGKRQSSGWD